jgi:hypothetical protein
MQQLKWWQIITAPGDSGDKVFGPLVLWSWDALATRINMFANTAANSSALNAVT